MNRWVLALFALLLAPERIVYMVICHAPDAFVRASRVILRHRTDPVRCVAFLFVGFKVLQIVVFVAWCVLHADGVRPARDAVVVAAGLALVAAGQILNLSVFRRLGQVGVFYMGTGWARRSAGARASLFPGSATRSTLAW